MPLLSVGPVVVPKTVCRCSWTGRDWSARATGLHARTLRPLVRPPHETRVFVDRALHYASEKAAVIAGERHGITLAAGYLFQAPHFFFKNVDNSDYITSFKCEDGRDRGA